MVSHPSQNKMQAPDKTLQDRGQVPAHLSKGASSRSALLSMAWPTDLLSFPVPSSEPLPLLGCLSRRRPGWLLTCQSWLSAPSLSKLWPPQLKELLPSSILFYQITLCRGFAVLINIWSCLCVSFACWFLLEPGLFGSALYPQDVDLCLLYSAQWVWTKWINEQPTNIWEQCKECGLWGTAHLALATWLCVLKQATSLLWASGSLTQKWSWECPLGRVIVKTESTQQQSLACSRKTIKLPSSVGPGTVRRAQGFSGSWRGLCCLNSGTSGFLNTVPPEVPQLTIAFDQILCFHLRVTSSPIKERKAFCEPRHMKKKASKWIIKENVFPGPHGEEHFRAKRSASVWGLRVLSTQPEQRPNTREQSREEEKNPKVGLSLPDERLFSLLICSLWGEPQLARCQSCRLGGWPHWKREGWPPPPWI